MSLPAESTMAELFSPQSTSKKRVGVSLFGRLLNPVRDALRHEVRRNSADKATAFRNPLGGEKTLPQNASRPKPLCVISEICV
jgi:hypothetical protein